jgi:hypothetical protein
MSKIFRTKTVALGIAVALLAATSIAATKSKPPCRVTGAWELASMTRDGKAVEWVPQRKLVTKKYWMWINQEARRDTLPLRTAGDSARVYRVLGGSGTYKVSGANYTEHIDFFLDQSMIGTDFKATCRTTANRWYHSYSTDADTTSHTPSSLIVEEWRRVE